jgi:transposase
MRSPHSLTEKLAIVKEALAPGASAADVSRSHGISLRMLYRWRKAYGDMAATDAGDDLAGLKLQVRHLERLLGQRTLEVALLRERLGMDHDPGPEA